MIFSVEVAGRRRDGRKAGLLSFLKGYAHHVYLVPLCLQTHHMLVHIKNLLVGYHPNALPRCVGVYLLAWCVSCLLILNSTCVENYSFAWH